MSKLIGFMVKPLFALFCAAVIVGVMYWSFQALGRIFPGDLASQLFGMMLFDFASLIWFFVLIKNCRSTFQYVWSAFGFLIGLAGTLGLVAIEVGLSSSMFAAADVVHELTYIFIGVIIAHLILTYAFHASEPEVSADISLGIEKAKITDKAQAAVEKKINDRIDQLASPIADKLMRDVLQDLNIAIHFKDMIDLPALPVEENAEKKADPNSLEEWRRQEVAKNSFLSWLPISLVEGVKKWNTNAASVEIASPVVTPKQSPAAQSVESEEAEGLEQKKK